MTKSYIEKIDNDTNAFKQFFADSGINRFGQRLQEAMKAKGIGSNVKLAAMVDMSETVIRSYINGRTLPTLDRLALLAYACDCSINWLATGESDSNKKTIKYTKINKENDFMPGGASLRDLVATMKALDTQELDALSKIVRRKGAELLAALLDTDNQYLMQLQGIKRQAALLLQDMPESRVREILAKIESSAGGATITEHSASA